jgi:hypothetical protein
MEAAGRVLHDRLEVDGDAVVLEDVVEPLLIGAAEQVFEALGAENAGWTAAESARERTTATRVSRRSAGERPRPMDSRTMRQSMAVQAMARPTSDSWAPMPAAAM